MKFITNFKADFVGFSQKPYKVGFFAYIHILTGEVDNTGMEEKAHASAES